MPQLITGASSGARTFASMVDAAQNVQHNADAPWNTFSSHDYWRRNYSELQAEDREIIHRVSKFFIEAFATRPLAQRGIDVGSGTNLYPALLMLPWTEQILLTDHSETNITWLRDQLADLAPGWSWRPFWQEMQGSKGYSWVHAPCELLRKACAGEPGFAGIEHRSVFDLPKGRWELGTMFFVAESITRDLDEFHAAVAHFVDALMPGAPFAAAFMAGSNGYEVGNTRFPAVPVTEADIKQHFTDLGAEKLSVEVPATEHRVRHGYEAMIVATGYTRSA